MFDLVPIEKIQVGNRIREDLGDIDGFSREIEELGFLINPITLTPDFRILTGYRRLQACKQLGWKTIPALIVSEVDR